MICVVCDPQLEDISLSECTNGILLRLEAADGGSLHLRFSDARRASGFLLALAKDLVALTDEKEFQTA